MFDEIFELFFGIPASSAVKGFSTLESRGMSLPFEIEKTRDTARKASLRTFHGEIETPVFMPVGTQAAVKAVAQDVLEELNVQILLGNTYHL